MTSQSSHGYSHIVTLTLVVMTLTYGTDCLDYYSKSPLKAYDVSSHIGKSATLRCQLRTGRHNRGWFRLTWSRIEPDGTPLQLVHLPVRDKIPSWSKELSSNLKLRTKALITIQPGHVEFNIRFDNITCQDESEYRCSAITTQGEVLSVAELSVYARPRPPNITESRNLTHLDRHLNHSTRSHKRRHGASDGRIHLTCRGDVGLPPKMLVWYIKEPKDTYFNIIDKQHGLTEELEGCHVIRARTLVVHTKQIPLGTRYRCGYPGFIANEGMYDQWSWGRKTPVKKIKHKRKEDLRCQLGNCNVGRSTRDGVVDNVNDHGHLTRPVISLLVILVMAASSWIVFPS